MLQTAPSDLKPTDSIFAANWLRTGQGWAGGYFLDSLDYRLNPMNLPNYERDQHAIFKAPIMATGNYSVWQYFKPSPANSRMVAAWHILGLHIRTSDKAKEPPLTSVWTVRLTPVLSIRIGAGIPGYKQLHCWRHCMDLDQ